MTKKNEVLKGFGDNTDKLTVQKSKNLVALWSSDLTLAEFKILDIYLSRIDSHKPNMRTVIFEKGEIEKVLDVQKINNTDLKTRLKHLMQNVVEVPDNDVEDEFVLVTLFEEVQAKKDDYGLWQVKLECTQKAMKYFFNVESLGYLRYKLRCITSISSRYTYIMFLYLENNKYRVSWDVDLQELKQILACDKEKSYSKFKVFNDRILKRVQEEMHEKTECRFSYESIKKGRFVVAIRFTYLTKKEVYSDETNINDVTDEQLSITQEQQHQFQRQQALWESALEDLNLSSEQIDEIRAILVTIPADRLPSPPAHVGIDDIEIRQFHYLQIKVAEIERRDYIKNKYAYLIKLLRQDANLS